MHFTDTVYRNPYWATFPLLQITQGCTHNKCKFCTMYKDVKFRLHPLEWIEEDLKELAEIVPDAKTIQLLSANPLYPSYDRLALILEMILQYLPQIEFIYTQGRVTDLKNKTVDQLRKLKELGMKEISLGVESGDDLTLERINKGCRSQDILEQCHKLEEAGIDYWMAFLNGVAGKSHSREHAINSAKIFNQCKPMLVGTGGLTSSFCAKISQRRFFHGYISFENEKRYSTQRNENIGKASCRLYSARRRQSSCGLH